MTIRVLVVDDSAFARKVLREVLSAAPGIVVLDIARDGAEALEKIVELRPDVITLDLVMPQVDGLGVLRALPAVGAPRVVVVSVSGDQTELGMEALALGAVAVVEKPTALATDRLYEVGAELVRAVTTAARAQPRALAASIAREVPSARKTRTELVVIGTSTGGPPALARLLASLPAAFPVPVAVVVHLPADYTEAFAQRLDAGSKVTVREATDGALLQPGHVVIARGGSHLTFERRGSDVAMVVGGSAMGGPHCPSADALFASAAKVYGDRVLGVVLTGMGDDGTAGARAIVAAGGSVLTETEASCVIYGMPRCVDEAGLSSGSAAIEDMAALIVERL